MPRTAAWKKTELAVSKKLGGTRTGPQGRAIEDVTTSRYVVECKHKKELPKWLHDAMRQAQGAASKKPDHLALVVLHQHRMRHSDDYVVIKMADFVSWFGDIDVPEGEEETND